MKVLHLSTTDVLGGAARGAFWLHQALEQQGVDTAMLVNRKYGDDDSVVALDEPFAKLARWVRAELDQLPLRFYQSTGESYWTVGWIPHHIERAVERLDPDIIHLHWTGGGFLSVESLSRLNRPLVWTLRDMWAFTGGCHYTAGCERYKDACGHCPQLRSTSANDLSRWTWRRKKKGWDDLDLWLVPISTWLARCGRSSELFQDKPMEVIPNGVDATRFHPVDKRQARDEWGFEPGRSYILFGAFEAANDPRKGLPQMAEALREMSAQGWGDRAEVAVFGGPTEADMPNLGMPARFLGAIKDDRKLASLYSAADVMVVPSLQEAFGKTVIEAMACGTPVVAFDSGGPADIIEHARTGYLAKSFDPEDLARGIAWCLENKERVVEMGARAREAVEAEFDIAVVARRYCRLYERILEQAA